jgi:hypothetical protein
MIWTIHYRRGDVAGLRAVNSRPAALMQACELLAGGAEVSGIENDAGLEPITAGEIRQHREARLAKR